MAKEFRELAITNLEGAFNSGILLIENENALLSVPAQKDVGVGPGALVNSVVGSNDNTAVGFGAMGLMVDGGKSTAVGMEALLDGTSGTFNTALGRKALTHLTTGGSSTGLGAAALRFKQDTTDNTDLSNCTGVGANTAASADNQVQLGDSSTTTFAYGAVQDRSDARDKADIVDSPLGLDFVNKLRPVSFRWDMRDDYKETNDEGDTVRIEKDGSKKRSRLHYGVIAQELKAVMDEVGVDFGGYQDHSKSKGGCDVLSVGYTEFIGPLIKAVQELTEKNEQLEDRIRRLE